MRTYDQYCPVARALDVVGDRWTLLVLRELTFGPQRFTDLKRELRGIPPKVLVERLETLQEHGLVERRAVADAPSRHVYALTANGEEVREPLRALARFGARYLPAGAPERVRPRAALSALLLAYARPVPEAAGARWRVVLDGESFDLLVDPTGVPRVAERAGGEPDDGLTASIADLAALRRDHRPLRDDADPPIARAFALSGWRQAPAPA